MRDDTLPEWGNLLSQINALHALVPAVTALTLATAAVDKNLGIVQSQISDVQTAILEIRRRLEHVEWTGNPRQPLPTSVWQYIAIGMFVLLLLAVVFDVVHLG